ncbi:MAG: efflux RND transporter permease subunit, partial [Acidobacteriota bacterium]
MKSLLRAALDRPVSVLVASAALVVLGAASLRQLPVSLLPDLERPRLVVVVEDSTRSRDSLSTEIVEALEVRLMALEGVVSVVTQIDDGLARIDVSTDWQTDVDRLRMQAERQFASADKAGVALSVSTSSGEREPVLQVAVSGGAEVRRTEFVRNVLLPELARVPGVSGVRRVGGARERVVVRPVPSALAVRGLTNLDVELALRGVGTTEPLGMVRDGDTLRTAVVSSSVSSLNDLSSLAVPPAEATGNGRDEAKSGVPVPVLGDVAELEIEELLEGGAYLVNDRGALLLELFRTPSANAVLLARRARQSLREVTARAPPGLQIEVVGDASAEVVAALRELALAGLLGLGLGTIVVRLFLGSWVPTLSLMVVVPASVIAAFAAFLFWGVSLDVVALAGLALALGMLVDNSIVVLEAISSRRGERTEDRVELEGTTAVALPLVAALLTTAAVFVPLLYLRGLARAFFGVQAFAIVSALAISLALSLTVTPVLSRVLAGRRTGGRTPRNPGHDTYLILLRVALRRPLLVSTLAVVFATAVLALGWAGLERELVPRGTGQAVLSEFSLEADLDARSVRERLAQVSAALTAEMESFSPSVERLTMRYEPLRPRDPNSDPFSAPGRLRVSLDRSVDPAAVARRIAESLATFPGLDARTRVERALFARTLLRLSGDQRIEVKASTHQRASALARRVIDSLQGAGLATRALVPRQRTAWALNWRTAELAKQGASRAQA